MDQAQPISNGYAVERVHPALMSFLHGAPNAEFPAPRDSFAEPAPPTAERMMGLTPREQEVLAAIAQGCTNRQIARRLEMKEGTVKTHLYSIFRKLAVPNRAAAALCGARLNEVQPPEIDDAAQGRLNLTRLHLEMSRRRVRAGERVFRAGDVANELFYIKHGRIDLPEIGKTLGPEDVFGEIGIFTPERKRTCSAVCGTDVELLSLTAAQARRIYLTNPQFALFVLTLIGTRLLADCSRRGRAKHA
jgi:two-component system, NarL family, nitrate/nitrite response regulator NarL